MPEYGKPIENNLHWKSTLDFFKDDQFNTGEGGGKELRGPSFVANASEHMQKPEPQRNLEFNKYVSGLSDGQKYPMQDHVNHFQHALSAFGTFKDHGLPDGDTYPGSPSPVNRDFPGSVGENQKYSFKDAISFVRGIHQSRHGAGFTPSDWATGHYSEKPKKNAGMGREWLQRFAPNAQNAHQRHQGGYETLLRGIEANDPAAQRGGDIWKKAREETMGGSILSGDARSLETLMQDHFKRFGPDKAFRELRPGPMDKFQHPGTPETRKQFAEEQAQKEAERKENQRQDLGRKLRRDESPLLGRLPPGIENSLLKLMKEDMPEVPGPEYKHTMARDADRKILDERGKGLPPSSVENPQQSAANMSAVQAGGEDKPGEKVPQLTPFTVRDEPFDIFAHNDKQVAMKDMLAAVNSGRVKLTPQENELFTSQMEQWMADQKQALKGSRYHPAFADDPKNRALLNDSSVEKALLKLMKQGDVEKGVGDSLRRFKQGLTPDSKREDFLSTHRGAKPRYREEQVGRAIRQIPMKVADRVHREMNPEMLGDAAEAGVLRPGREFREGLKSGWSARNLREEDISPPIGEYEPAGEGYDAAGPPTGPAQVGERMGYGAGRATTVPSRVGRATRDFFQPEDTYQSPEQRPLMSESQIKQRSLAAQNRREGKGPMELAVEKALLKLMKGGDAQKLNAMDNPPKENKDSQALVADGDSKRPKSEVGTNEEMFKKEFERVPRLHERPSDTGGTDEIGKLGRQRPLTGFTPKWEHEEDSRTGGVAAEQQDLIDTAKKKIGEEHTIVNPPLANSIEKALLKLMKEEPSEEDAKDIYRQRQINRRMAPQEHGQDDDIQSPPMEGLGVDIVDSSKPGVKTTKPLKGWKFAEGPEGQAQMEAWWKEHVDKKPQSDIEESLLKLMKDSDLSPSKVGMSRKNAMRNIENATTSSFPKPQAPRGVGANTAANSNLPSATEMESRRPDSDPSTQTANWSAQMFAGDVAGKFNRRFGTGKQDYIEDQKRRAEWDADFKQQYPQYAQDAQSNPYQNPSTDSQPQAPSTPPVQSLVGDETSTGFGQSGKESQENFQRQTGTMGNTGKPVYYSIKGTKK